MTSAHAPTRRVPLKRRALRAVGALLAVVASLGLTVGVAAAQTSGARTAGPSAGPAPTVRVVERGTGAPVSDAEVRLVDAAGTLVGRPRLTGPDGRVHVPGPFTEGVFVQVSKLGLGTAHLPVAQLESQGWQVVLDDDPLRLDELVVTVAGRAQRRSQIAVPVQQITSREIEASGAPSAVDLLEDIPGLQTTGGVPTGQNIMIRGIGDQRVLILVDGLPVSGALIEDRDLSRLSLAAVERVEVVKGPLSSLYGSDALGGVINIITAEPTSDFNMEVGATQGGDGRRDLDLTVEGGGALRYRITGSLREQDRVPGLPDDLDAFSRVWDLRSTARWQGDGGLRIRSDLTLLRERQKWPVGGGFNGFNDNLSVTGWAEGALPVGDGSLSLRVIGQDYSHLYRSSRTDAPISGAGEEDRQQERVLRSILMWSATLGSHGLDVGIDVSSREIASPDKILQDQASDRQLELFAQDAWQLGATTLSGGVRATFNDQWGNAVSPTLGVSSLVGDRLQLRASVGRGFRAPSFKELAWDFANLGAGYTVQGFSELQAESSWNTSAGLDWAPLRGVRLKAEVFNNDIEGLVELVQTGTTPGGLLVFSPQNLERATTRGVEVGAEWRTGRWLIGADYALLDTESAATGLPLDRRARHSAQLRLGGEFGLLEGLRIDLSTAFTGAAPVIGLGSDGLMARIDTQEALVATDARAALEVLRGVQLEMGVENLFNQRPEGWQDLVIQRRVRLGVRARELF